VFLVTLLVSPTQVSFCNVALAYYLVFEQHAEWWDILCNINTGKVIISPQILQQQAAIPEQHREKHAELDNEFMNNVSNT
jgi:hypothetical protein